MYIFSYIFSYLGAIYIMILITYTLRALLPARSGVKAHFFVVSMTQLILLLSMYLVDYFTKSNLFLVPLLAPVPPLITTLLWFRGNIFSRLAAYTFIYECMAFADIAPLMIFTCLGFFFPEVAWLPTGTDNPYRAETIIPIKIIISFIFTCCMNTITFFFFTKLFRHRFITYRPAGLLKIGVALIASLLMFNIFANFMPIKPSLLQQHMLPANIVFWTLSAFCLYVLVRGFSALEYSELLRLKKISKQKNDEILSRHMQSIEKEFLANRKWNHDINNHLSAITTLIECGEKETALNYVDLLLEKGNETA